MEEFLKIHANGQWELCKARQLTPEELRAHKEKRDAWLREKFGKPAATEADKKLPPKEAPTGPVRPDMSIRAQKMYNERVVNNPKIERDEKTNKLIVPEGSHPVDVKPTVRQGSRAAKKLGDRREVIKRPRQTGE